MNIDDCASAECGKGTCIDGISSHSCNCSGTGYNGTKCENDIDECDSMPCNHNGTCSNYGGGYTCNCNVGYSGKNCENNIDDCALRPCKNGGECNACHEDPLLQSIFSLLVATLIRDVAMPIRFGLGHTSVWHSS